MSECNFCKYHDEPEWCSSPIGICNFKMVSKKNYKDRLLSEYDVIKAIYENVNKDEAIQVAAMTQKFIESQKEREKSEDNRPKRK